jgi:hypothetical protein
MLAHKELRVVDLIRAVERIVIDNGQKRQTTAHQAAAIHIAQDQTQGQNKDFAREEM